MNEQLKFSWGHIVAFLALVAISYVSFVGVTYMTDGDFAKAFMAMAVIDAVLFAFFIGAQMAKATTRKFAKLVWLERILVFGSPVAFLLCMLPCYHFATVQSQDDEIVANFNGAISASLQMFADYDAYSDERISNYEHLLDRVIADRDAHPDQSSSCGFSAGREKFQRDNMVESLRLQLLSENYDSLKTEATKWIEAASQGASTWNVFLLGNTKEIKRAIHEWNAQLDEFSRHKMANEEFGGYNQVNTFGEVSHSLASVDNGLDSLASQFTESCFPPLGAVIGSVVAYFALLFPYILQDRHTKSQMRLLGSRKAPSQRMDIEEYGLSSSPNPPGEGNDYASFSLGEGNDYASFTL